jgi:hypothetical protein
MIPIVLLSVTLSVNLLNATLHVLNLKTLFAMLNVRNPNVKLNAQIKDVKCLIVPNVLQFAKLLIVLLIVKHLNPNVRLSAKNQNVTGNATNQTAPSPNVSLFVKIPTVFLKLNAVLAIWEEPELDLLYPSLKKLKRIKNVALAINRLI